MVRLIWVEWDINSLNIHKKTMAINSDKVNGHFDFVLVGPVEV